MHDGLRDFGFGVSGSSKLHTQSAERRLGLETSGFLVFFFFFGGGGAGRGGGGGFWGGGEGAGKW